MSFFLQKQFLRAIYLLKTSQVSREIYFALKSCICFFKDADNIQNYKYNVSEE